MKAHLIKCNTFPFQAGVSFPRAPEQNLVFSKSAYTLSIDPDTLYTDPYPQIGSTPSFVNMTYEIEPNVTSEHLLSPDAGMRSPSSYGRTERKTQLSSSFPSNPALFCS